MDSGYDESTLQ